jgi:hypothetical protein
MIGVLEGVGLDDVVGRMKLSRWRVEMDSGFVFRSVLYPTLHVFDY